MIQVAQNAQKRQKVNEGSGGKPYFETIAMKLWEQQRELRKNYDDGQLEAIEVEVRGYVHDALADFKLLYFIFSMYRFGWA